MPAKTATAVQHASGNAPAIRPDTRQADAAEECCHRNDVDRPDTVKRLQPEVIGAPVQDGKRLDR